MKHSKYLKVVSFVFIHQVQRVKITYFESMTLNKYMEECTSVNEILCQQSTKKGEVQDFLTFSNYVLFYEQCRKLANKLCQGQKIL